MRPTTTAPAALVLAGVLTVLIAPVTPARAQGRAAVEEGFFGLEWRLEGAGGAGASIAGVLTNPYLFRLERVRLQAQVVDATGQVTHETLESIGDVPAGGRAAFRLPLPAAGARYLVTVHSFEFGPRESP